MASQGAKNIDESKYVCKFTAKGKKMKDEPVTKEQRVQEAKAFWGAFFTVHGNQSNPDALKKGRRT